MTPCIKANTVIRLRYRCIQVGSPVPERVSETVEMSAAKSCVSLCWDVFRKEVCKELGFLSTNALAYAKKGAHHHKLWDILEICYISFCDKLLISNIRDSRKSNMDLE